MDSIETKQRIRYLIEHGGLWEQARDDNARTHRIIMWALSFSISLQLLEILLEHVLR